MARFGLPRLSRSGRAPRPSPLFPEPAPATTPAAPAGSPPPPPVAPVPHPPAPSGPPPQAGPGVREQPPLPATQQPQTTAARLAYQQAQTRLQGAGFKVHDEFDPHHDLTTRAQAFNNIHDALSHVHNELPWMSKLSQYHNLRLHLSGDPQVGGDGGQIHGMYKKDEEGPRIDIHDRAHHTLWHEYGHFLDHSLNGLKGTTSINPDYRFSTEGSGQSRGTYGQTMNDLTEGLKGTPEHRNEMFKLKAWKSPEHFMDYAKSNPEVFARFFNDYMDHTYHQVHGSTPPSTGALWGETYSPQNLAAYGRMLRDVVSHNALQLGKPFERVGPTEVHTRGAPEIPYTIRSPQEAGRQMHEETIRRYHAAGRIGARDRELEEYGQEQGPEAADELRRDLARSGAPWVREAAWAEQLPEGRWVTLGGPRGVVHLFVRESDQRIVAGPQPLLGAEVGYVLTVHRRAKGHTVVRYGRGLVPMGMACDAGVAINVAVAHQGWRAAADNYQRLAAGYLR